ncbi:hypothetical protein F4802DRAFT_580001 [Xylaria palmicola]|nr:hypothetical protein F4802DRAFT_580001 [Xylaria palmicola]
MSDFSGLATLLATIAYAVAFCQSSHVNCPLLFAGNGSSMTSDISFTCKIRPKKEYLLVEVWISERDRFRIYCLAKRIQRGALVLGGKADGADEAQSAALVCNGETKLYPLPPDISPYPPERPHSSICHISHLLQ